LRGLLILAGLLAVAFVLLSTAVGLGFLGPLDNWTAWLAERLWQSKLHRLFQAGALFGGAEMTMLAALGLAFYLYRNGFRREAWVALVLPLSVLVELIYKHLLIHPGPDPTFHHADGPSLSMLLTQATGNNSFPSGHVLRTAVIYGLIAFVAYRLGLPRRGRTLVVVLAVMLTGLMSIDRVYLGVHWLSDVLGGLLLGGLLLVLAIIWLDRVPRSANPQ
jgi:undecaprenyl-diphosphatase